MEEIKKYRILLCEDDINLGVVLKKFLELNEFEVILERDGELGFASFQRQKIDLCLLDVMMPNVDGFKLAEDIRDIDPDVPLFFLSAKTMKDDIIQGYQLGADDYITKPFDSAILLLKIKNILEREEESIKISDATEYDFGKYHFDPILRHLTYKGNVIILSQKENALLKLLGTYKNAVLPRDLALKKIWGTDTYFNGRSMDVYITKLRKHLREDPNLEIINIHGTGFRFVTP